MELRGEKVILRAMERVDCRKLFEDYEPPFPLNDVVHMGFSLESADEWFEKIQQSQGKEQCHLGIFLSTNPIVGDITLSHINWRDRTATLKLSICKDEHRVLDIIMESIRLMMKYAFDELGLARVSANAIELNELMLNSLAHAGFVQEGRERQSVYLSGKRVDRLIFSLLAEEWEQQRGPRYKDKIRYY